jgi:hypothetical protein
LVGHHSCAVIEAEERGLAGELSREFLPADPVLSDALSYCDMTTTPGGGMVSVQDRLAEIRERYGPQSLVTRFTFKAESSLISSVSRTVWRLQSVLRSVDDAAMLELATPYVPGSAPAEDASICPSHSG